MADIRQNLRLLLPNIDSYFYLGKQQFFLLAISLVFFDPLTYHTDASNDQRMSHPIYVFPFTFAITMIGNLNFQEFPSPRKQPAA